MREILFNDGWKFRRLSGGAWTAVDLPHDAMLLEPRSPDADSGTNAGWYVCYDYEYIKTFNFQPGGGEVVFEFEGVYRNAEVYINGRLAASRPYGYTNFYVPATELLHDGENELRVIAHNSDQPNSRWYSGAGIYRSVKMLELPAKHILINGIKVRTVSIDPAAIEVRVETNCGGKLTVQVCGQTLTAETDGRHTFTAELPGAKLWSVDEPNLYELTASFEGDSQSVSFGVRTAECDAKRGFLINGERVILRGACIHHDNGILGACCYPDAEERKIRILKEAGYNAVRSAHNPCSKAMLDACDRLGMLMVDEYVDMWYIHKTKYDYADYIAEWYERDITDMVNKDYNHPCVIMYSLGNEVSETAQPRGIEFFNKMKSVIKSLDDRPVTTGVNIFFNYLSSKGFGVYSDKKANDNPQKKVGSEFFNNLAGIMGAGFMKWGATLRGSDRTTRECFAAMDVAGYNYGINRYKKDVIKYPDRVILGSETFCADAYRFYEFAKKHNAVIGDFVWAGIDYLGEVGIGSREYRDYAPKFTHGVGWVSAGSGRVDLTGKPLAEASYTKVAFELIDTPVIAVTPVPYTREKHSPSSWKMTNAIESWSWRGCEGKPARVEVYARAAAVELQINGKRVGRKRLKNDCRVVFKTKYYSGEVTAIAYDCSGNELSRSSLRTAGEETMLSVKPESDVVTRGGLVYVRLAYTDGGGVVKPMCRGKISVTAEGGSLLAVGHACPYNDDGYSSGSTRTYYGEALAIVKASGDRVVVTATDGELSGSAEVGVGL